MNTDHLSDKELVSRILSGHPDLFGPLVERHIRAAHAVAYARLGNAADAEDAVQEAFLRAYKRLASLRDPARFAAWLLAITRHEAAHTASRRDRAGVIPVATPAPSSYTDPDSAAPALNPDPAQHEMNQLLREHITRLPHAAREILLLHYFAGHSAREIACLLDLRRPAVLKRLQRAREALAETLLHDLETAKPVPETMTKHAARITALAGALTIEKAVAGGVATAATTSFGLARIPALFPKTGTIAAAIAGMVFTAGIGWVYLSKQAAETVDAASESSALVSVVQSVPLEPEAPVAEVPAALPEASVAPILLAQADATATTPSVPAQQYPNATGTWDINVIMMGTHEEHLGMATITDLGGILRIVPQDTELERFYYDCQRRGSTITLRMDDSDARGTLTGSFDTGFTTLTMTGTIATGSDGNGNPLEMDIELIAKRLDPNAPSRDELVTLLREQMRALHPKLQQYAAANGEYPAGLSDLSPDYIHDPQQYRSTETRTYSYTRPAHFDEVAIEQLTSAVTSANSAAELAAIEEQLLDLWGDRFLRIPAVLDVRDADLNVHLVLGLNGFVTEITDFRAIPENTSPAVKDTRARAQNAACMNNMKQLGLVMKMFEHEQAANLWPAGWRMTYPEYMTDVTILTCPGHEPGTESYDLLFPGVTAAWLMALARTLEGLPEDTSHATLQSFVPVLVETDYCNGLNGRNVLYLDGHVSRIGDADWEAHIAPYLRYR